VRIERREKEKHRVREKSGERRGEMILLEKQGKEKHNNGKSAFNSWIFLPRFCIYKKENSIINPRSPVYEAEGTRVTEDCKGPSGELQCKIK